VGQLPRSTASSFFSVQLPYILLNDLMSIAVDHCYVDDHGCVVHVDADHCCHVVDVDVDVVVVLLLLVVVMLLLVLVLAVVVVTTTTTREFSSLLWWR